MSCSIRLPMTGNTSSATWTRSGGTTTSRSTARSCSSTTSGRRKTIPPTTCATPFPMGRGSFPTTIPMCCSTPSIWWGTRSRLPTPPIRPSISAAISISCSSTPGPTSRETSIGTLPGTSRASICS